ncbi:hypothetical protein ACTXT7_004236 [Hymenolepis weldensis]
MYKQTKQENGPLCAGTPQTFLWIRILQRRRRNSILGKKVFSPFRKSLPKSDESSKNYLEQVTLEAKPEQSGM